MMHGSLNIFAGARKWLADNKEVLVVLGGLAVYTIVCVLIGALIW